MSKIINFSDRNPSGTFYQIQLDDGKRILVSFTQNEIAILKLIFGGAIPIKKIFKHNIEEFLDFFCVRVKQIDINDSLLKAVVDYILPCKNIEEVTKKLNMVIEGYNNPSIKADIQEKLEKQVYKLFINQ
jgi:Lhr-like helicase